MKKGYILILCLSLLSLQSCLKEDNEMFDQSAFERVEKQMNDCKATLTSAENGWVMEYFPNGDYAGAYFYMKFKAGSDTVAVASELNTENVNELVNSLYSFKSDAGPTINFDSYNRLFHHFSDPDLTEGNGKGEGYNGDYEFIIQNVTDNSIYLRGKKGKSVAYMTRLSSNSTFSDFLQTIKAADALIAGESNWFLIDKNDTLVMNGDSKRHFAVYSPLNLDYVWSVSVLPTPDGGLRFYPGLELNGHSYDLFKLSDDKNSLIPVENGLPGKIVSLDIFEYYNAYMSKSKTWTIKDQDDAMSSKVRSAYNIMKNSVENGGRTLSVGLCLDSKSKRYALKTTTFKGTAGTSGLFYYDFSQGDKSVTYTYKGEYDKNGGVYIKNFSGFEGFAELLGSTYNVVPVTSGMDLSSIKLVSKNDPDIWFIVQK